MNYPYLLGERIARVPRTQATANCSHSSSRLSGHSLPAQPRCTLFSLSREEPGSPVVSTCPAVQQPQENTQGPALPPLSFSPRQSPTTLSRRQRPSRQPRGWPLPSHIVRPEWE